MSDETTGPRTLYGPMVGIGWEDLDQLDGYLITEIPAPRTADGPRGDSAYAVRAYRQDVGTAATLAEARELVMGHIGEHLVLIEEPGSDRMVWEVAVADPRHKQG